MSTATLLIELGTEELPPKSLQALGLAFRDGIVAGLARRQLAHAEAEWFATPRRLAVQVPSLQLVAAARELEVLGPPLDRARDTSGAWTAAALGFAQKQGVEPAQLQHIDTPKGARLGVRITEAGVSARDALEDIIRESIEQLPIARRMRWGAGRDEFVRPVHWTVVMLDRDVVPVNVLGHTAAAVTRGHRVHHDQPITLAHAQAYDEALLGARVVASFAHRRERIREQVIAAAAALGANAVIDDALLDEVTGLVEWPVALAGDFEPRFLAVPAEALVSTMKENQKYFHVVDNDGRLQPHFITVANLESRDPAQVVAGNERVIRPRLADAAFFYDADRKKPLAERVAALEGVVFQQQLGSLADKTRRLVALAGLLAPALGADPAQAARAALLCKADLVTDMVLEFPDMQGIAGRYYALHDSEPAAVADALAQQYWPKFAGDRIPREPVACCIGLADRLDTLVGIFGIGQAPTGSRDPFALRRASLAVLRIIVENEIDLDLAGCLTQAADAYPAGVLAAGTADQALGYMLERFRAWYEEDGIAVEVFRAVSALQLTQPLEIHRRVQAVHAFSQLPQAQALAAANKRVANILEKLDADHAFGPVRPDQLAEPAEHTLADALAGLSATTGRHLAAGEYRQTLAALATLRDPVDAFFDSVLVNADDPALRSNRLNLLHALRAQFLGVADISQLVVAR